MTKRTSNTSLSKIQTVFPDEHLLGELSQLIEQSRNKIAIYANSTLAILFWQVGKRINEEILKNQRAEYGKQILPILSAKLESRYGRNFTEKNVRRMIQFSDVFSDFQIVVTLSRQLSWSHFLVLIPLKSNESKQFYAELAINETLGVRDLRKRIANRIFVMQKIVC